MNIVSVFEMKGNQYWVGSHMALEEVYEAVILSMICDIVQYLYGIPERCLNFTIFNRQLIHMIRQIKVEKRVSSSFKSFSHIKKNEIPLSW